MHHQSHSIVRLQVHLPDHQHVAFYPNQIQSAVNKAAVKETTLTAWFKLNRTDPQARQYLYVQVPEFYRFYDNKWNIRKREANNTMGRMYAVNMDDRMLLSLRTASPHTWSCHFAN